MQWVYPLASCRLAVSKGVAQDLAALSGLAQDAFHVIYNPAALGRGRPQFIPEALLGVFGPLVLSVGTLKAGKRHNLLIEAFARLPVELGAMLCILGEGSLRPALEQQIRELGLQKRVLLPGFRADPTPWYARADLFVLSSDYEGFGNVIVEALEQGVPVVSTNCPAGPSEILCSGKYGRLVPVGDADALATAMLEALNEEPDREALKTRARDFAADKIAEEYLDVMLPSWRGGQAK